MERGEEIRKHLFSLVTRGIKYDLDRMNSAVEACGRPQDACPSFHVAGTNGKGSICSYLESSLRSCGFKTGLFTSPHLVRFEERFMIDGRPVRETVWLETYRDLQPVIEKFRLTFFEASALMAFEIFRRHKVEWAVFEAGLGGRLDATNVVVPAVSIISRIAMDHMEYLGNDLASIASEKLGIVKRGVPLIAAEPESGAIKSLIAGRSCEIGTSCRFVSNADGADCTIDPHGASFTWDNIRYRINLPGSYQVTNALLALSALKAAKGTFNDNRSIMQGLRDAWLPGRFQTLTIRTRNVVFDVGHNPDAAMAFCRSLQSTFKGRSVCCVLGIMKDKDIAGIMTQYTAVASRLICTAPATGRAAEPERIKKNIPGTFKGVCMVAGTVASAVETAFKSPEEIICIAGSFFTVGEAMEYLHIDPWESRETP
jgi:dihydrofolate synthase / folylpolyglutamate synthase